MRTYFTRLPAWNRLLRVGALLTSLCIFTASCTPGNGSSAPDGNDEELPLPSPVSSLSGIGWEWETPPGREIVAVEPVAMGAAVLLDSGIVVLHGDTGEEIWNHLVPEEQRFAVGLTADRSAFLVAHGPDADGAPEETLMLDADTGTASGEFEVQDDLAPWDLWRVSEKERVHRPAGVVEEYRPLSVIEVASGDRRWQQEEPLKCETAPGLPSQQDDALIHEAALVVLVTCSPEQFEDPLEVTTSVVALDLANGSELWRQEFTYTSETTFPRASLAVGGGSVFLSGDRLQQVHSVDIETGEILTSAQGTALAFKDGDVLLQVDEGGESRYELRDAGLEELSSAEASSGPEDPAQKRHALPLREGVASAELVEDGTDSTVATVGFTPWEGGKIELLDSGLSAPQGTDFDEFTGSLVSVPGAVVLSGAEHWDANTLVAYQ